MNKSFILVTALIISSCGPNSSGICTAEYKGKNYIFTISSDDESYIVLCNGVEVVKYSKDPNYTSHRNLVFSERIIEYSISNGFSTDLSASDIRAKLDRQYPAKTVRVIEEKR